MKRTSFGVALEQYLSTVVTRSPFPWSQVGIFLCVVVVVTSLKYKKESIVAATNTRDAVLISSRQGDYVLAQQMWNESMWELKDKVFPEQRVADMIEQLENKLKIYPENRAIYLAMVELYRQIGNEELANFYLEKARILSPND